MKIQKNSTSINKVDTKPKTQIREKYDRKGLTVFTHSQDVAKEVQELVQL